MHKYFFSFPMKCCEYFRKNRSRRFCLPILPSFCLKEVPAATSFKQSEECCAQKTDVHKRLSFPRAQNAVAKQPQNAVAKQPQLPSKTTIAAPQPPDHNRPVRLSVPRAQKTVDKQPQLPSNRLPPSQVGDLQIVISGFIWEVDLE